MLCMALSGVLTNQSYVSLMDQVQHALHHQHAPNPLAGAIAEHEHSDHDHDGLHHHGDHGDDPASGAVTHKHLDSTVVYIVSVVPVLATMSQSSHIRFAAPEGLDRLYPYRLERPPKA
jgi:hypothetical protein